MVVPTAVIRHPPYSSEKTPTTTQRDHSPFFPSPFIIHYSFRLHSPYQIVSECRARVLAPMASSAPSIRFSPASSSTATVGTADALHRIFADLCTRGTPKVRVLFTV